MWSSVTPRVMTQHSTFPTPTTPSKLRHHLDPTNPSSGAMLVGVLLSRIALENHPNYNSSSNDTNTSNNTNTNTNTISNTNPGPGGFDGPPAFGVFAASPDGGAQN